MITKDMIEKGYEQGIVRLVESPIDSLDGRGVVCAIGDNWFYFGGDEAENSTVEEYRRNVPAEDIVNEIFEVLEGFWEDRDVFEDEYLYYEAFLNENLKEMPADNLREQAERFVRENPELAREIYRMIDRENHKEDIRKEELGNDFVDGDVTDGIVDKMVASIQGVGEGEGSGYFVLKSFEVDGETYEVVAEACRFEEESSDEVYYGVYHGVCYEGDCGLENSFDWRYTAQFDVDELKQIVREIANTDFSDNVREWVGKGSVAQLVEKAAERCGEQEVAASREREMGIGME